MRNDPAAASRPHRQHCVRAGVALIFALAGCQGVRSDVDPTFDFAAVRTFAWREEPSFGGIADPGEDEVVLGQVKALVEHELRSRGLTQVEKPAADVVIDAAVRVETRVQQNDPLYSVFTVEQYEQATLDLEMYARLQRQRVWAGKATDRLRYSARGVGLQPRFVSTGEPRNWHVEDLVRRVAGALPASLATAAPRSGVESAR